MSTIFQRVPTGDPAVPPRDDVVLRYVLERHARERPDEVFVVLADGSQWTYAQTVDRARRAACALARLGVRQGHRVLSWLPNGPDALRAWFGANWLGATYVPINCAYRGSLLGHVIENSAAEVMVCHPDFEGRLTELKLGRLRTVVLTGPAAGPASPAWQRVAAESLQAPVEDSLLSLPRPIEPWDEYCIIYTSGTTGPSKGVLCSYCHVASTVLACFEGKDAPGFRYMVTLPLFHAGGTIGVMAGLLLGRSIAIPDRFETARFWETVRRTASTCCTLLGAMATFLVKQSPGLDERRHGLQWAFVLPYTEDAMRFAQRFGVTTYTLFNMTEISTPLISGANPSVTGSCGRVRAGVQARIVDEHDVEVPVGSVGELIVRSDRPWAMNHGYNAMPEAAATAWRNGWFHTGDGFRRDQQGAYFFVDRIKDAIRRRGENISSFEVERECLAHAAVREAAAIAVPSELGEDDVMVVLAPVAGARLDPAEVFEFLRPRMAHFMLPRYIRLMPELPKTPTEKVQKVNLRRDGITADTWDRERAGINVKAERPRGAM